MDDQLREGSLTGLQIRTQFRLQAIAGMVLLALGPASILEVSGAAWVYDRRLPQHAEPGFARLAWFCLAKYTLSQIRLRIITGSLCPCSANLQVCHSVSKQTRGQTGRFHFVIG